MKLYVSNLSYKVQDEELRNYFASYGEVNSATVITDKETGRSRGFGFVEMTDDNEAQNAIRELDQSSLDGRQIGVSEAKPRTDRPSSGGKSPFKSNNNYDRRRW